MPYENEINLRRAARPRITVVKDTQASFSIIFGLECQELSASEERPCCNSVLTLSSDFMACVAARKLTRLQRKVEKPSIQILSDKPFSSVRPF